MSVDVAKQLVGNHFAAQVRQTQGANVNANPRELGREILATAEEAGLVVKDEFHPKDPTGKPREDFNPKTSRERTGYYFTSTGFNQLGSLGDYAKINQGPTRRKAQAYNAGVHDRPVGVLTKESRDKQRAGNETGTEGNAISKYTSDYQDAIVTFNPEITAHLNNFCLLYTSPSPRDRQKSRMPSSA